MTLRTCPLIETADGFLQSSLNNCSYLPLSAQALQTAAILHQIVDTFLDQIELSIEVLYPLYISAKLVVGRNFAYQRT